MNWTLSSKLLPGEEVVDQQEDAGSFGLQAVYTVILTNRRAIFRFNSLSTGLTQSFPYDEINDARPASRLLVKYLRLKVRGREYLLNVDEPDAWAWKIIEYKDRFGGDGTARADRRAGPSLADLLVMLNTLKEYGLLTESEYEEKRGKITR